MRKMVLVGLFVATAAAAPSALACDPRGGQAVQQVEIVFTAQTTLATQQSQSFLAEATRLDGKADIEEAASSTSLASAKASRRRAASIRIQAQQVSLASRSALLAKADRLDAEAAVSESASATFLSRAKLIRARARSLRTLSTRVLTSGAVSTTILARVQLPAPPANHPDRTPLRVLNATPQVATTGTMVAKI